MKVERRGVKGGRGPTKGTVKPVQLFKLKKNEVKKNKRRGFCLKKGRTKLSGIKERGYQKKKGKLKRQVLKPSMRVEVGKGNLKGSRVHSKAWHSKRIQKKRLSLGGAKFRGVSFPMGKDI